MALKGLLSRASFVKVVPEQCSSARTRFQKIGLLHIFVTSEYNARRGTTYTRISRVETFMKYDCIRDAQAVNAL